MRQCCFFARGSRLINPQGDNLFTLKAGQQNSSCCRCHVMFYFVLHRFFSGWALQLLVGSLYGDTAIDTAAPGSELLVDAACLLGFRLCFQNKDIHVLILSSSLSYPKGKNMKKYNSSGQNLSTHVYPRSWTREVPG